MNPVLAGRDAEKIARLAGDLSLEHRVFNLDDPDVVQRAIHGVDVVLHCAGPYIHTAVPVAAACIRAGAHYLDITGEIPAYERLLALDGEAKARGVMLLPGVGFDVVPTDCLALYLKQRLPTATRLALAFRSEGPARLPPGTQRTIIELIPYGDLVRRNGRLERPANPLATRTVDFGRGPVEATRLTWGDVFMAFRSTGIPNIEDYTVLPPAMRKQLAMVNRIRPLFKVPLLRAILKRGVKPGPTPEERARTTTSVWGEVEDAAGRKASARLHGPEAGVVWTMRAALAAVRRVLAGDAIAGFQTPAAAFGADFVMECEGVTREDVA